MLGLPAHRPARLLSAFALLLAGCEPDLTKPATDGTAHAHPFDDGFRYTWVTMNKLSVAAIDVDGVIHTWEQEGYSFPELPPERTYVRIEGEYSSFCGLDDTGRLVCGSEKDGVRDVNPDGPPAVSWAGDYYGRVLWVGDDGEVRWEDGTIGTPTAEVTESRFAVQVVGIIPPEGSTLFACLRFDDGSVSCWGGSGEAETGEVPPGDYSDISTDIGSTCVISDGHVSCWGATGQDDDCYPPRDWQPTGRYEQVESNDNRCAIDLDGRLVCQGPWDQYCPEPEGPITQVAPGMEQDCRVSAEGLLTCAYRELHWYDCAPLGCDYGHPEALMHLWRGRGGDD